MGIILILKEIPSQIGSQKVLGFRRHFEVVYGLFYILNFLKFKGNTYLPIKNGDMYLAFKYALRRMQTLN